MPDTERLRQLQNKISLQRSHFSSKVGERKPINLFKSLTVRLENEVLISLHAELLSRGSIMTLDGAHISEAGLSLFD